MDIGWKIASGITTAVAAILASRIAKASWRIATGHNAPGQPHSSESKLTEFVLFSAVSAAILAFVQQKALGRTYRWYHHGAADLSE